MNLRLLAVGATVALSSLGAWAQAASAASTPRVDQRQARQEQRIDQGVASGQLNARETARLEKEQAVIDKAENRAKSDGTVTKKERARLHRMQNHASRDIRHQKHDRQTAAASAKP
ncbi:hypothetical protein BURC_01477 [Burkholderiaceae bacterium]|nr:hypothetical protein BURC_01477 [Burkholderiaceae bacterium]